MFCTSCAMTATGYEDIPRSFLYLGSPATILRNLFQNEEGADIPEVAV